MLIIDAYNVIHAAGKVEPSFGGLSIRQLVDLIDQARLADSGASRGGQILLVCDGTGGKGVGGAPQRIDEAMTAPDAPIRVTFAGPGKDADSAIERLLDELEYKGRGRSTTVVSSDKRVQAAALGVHAARITSEQFIRSLADILKREAGKAHARTGGRTRGGDPLAARDALDAGATAYWLKQFGVQPPPAPTSQTQTPAAHAPAPSATPTKSAPPPAAPKPVDPLIDELKQEWGDDIDPTDLDMGKWLKE